MSLASALVFDHLDQVAVIAAGLYAGSALFVNLFEFLAIKQISTDEHWQFFPHIYARVGPLEATFGLLAGIMSLLHHARIINSLSTDRNLWFTASSVFLGMLPYTLLTIMPINIAIWKDNRLIQKGEQSKLDSATKKKMLEKWNRLHSVRTAASVVAFSTMVYGLGRHPSLIPRW